MARSRKPAAPPLLNVEGLSITYRTRAGAIPAVREVSFSLERGEALGLVGESGCGKSTLAFAVMNYLGRSGGISAGQVRYKGRALAGLPAEELRALRGAEMAMVYQDPMSCLNPVMTVGAQLMEVPVIHAGAGHEQARQRALDILAEVALPDPAAVLERYPHQLSGGQQQRVVIGMALMGDPELLIMDEPTTGLDVTIEAAILELVAELRRRHGMALLFISHNLGTVLRVCERVGVMYCGELVEEGAIGAVFEAPRHPYTRGLLACLPRPDAARGALELTPIPGQMPAQPQMTDGCVFAARCEEVRAPACTTGTIPSTRVGRGGGHTVRCIRHAELPPWRRALATLAGAPAAAEGGTPLLEISDLEKHYAAAGGLTSWRGGEPVRALNGVSMGARKGETLAIVGESGCGKSTLAKVLTGLEGATGGSVRLGGVDVAEMPVEARPQELKQSLQMVFQHPDGTLNPSHTVGYAIGRSLRRLAAEPAGGIRAAVARLLRIVNLPEQFARRLPRQLSGGQKQRVAIARALAGNPALVVADEPVSALDVSVQAAIINLLLEIQQEQGTTMIFISHDLAVVRYLADHVAVMYLGRIMEFGRVEEVFAPPYHPYTEALLASAPVVDPKARQRRIILEGDLPSATEAARGCPFHSRCPRKLGPLCEETPPPEHRLPEGHRIACHIPLPDLRAIEPVFTSVKTGSR